MAKGGKTSYKRKMRNKVQLKIKGSDESDEDYTVSENEDFDGSEDEYSSSLADDESEESSGEFVEEKGSMKKKDKKVLRPRGQKGLQGKKKNGPSVISESDDFADTKGRKRTRLSSTDKYANRSNKNHGKKTEVSYREEKEDGDYNDSDDDEFTPEESDDLDEDEEFANGRKRKRNIKALKGTTRKEPIKKQGLRTQSRSNHGVRIRDESPKKSIVDSDSDSDSVTGSFEEEEIVPIQRTSQVNKGKEKVLDMKIEVVQQVCGICLSEEANKTVRGILNCCSHYFCFACIMEWSNVESRCPLCKQRFATINRTARADGKSDVTDTVITVPERDQIYQPTAQNPLPDNGLNNNLSVGSSSPVTTARQDFDLNESNGDSASGVSTLHERRRIQRQIHELRNLISTQLDRSGGVGPVPGSGSQVVQNGSTDPQNNHPQRSLLEHFFATFPTPRPSTSSSGDESPRELAEYNAMASFMLDRPFTRSLAIRLSRGDDRVSTREARVTSLGKEQVQSMVKSHLERFSKYEHLGYRVLNQLERTSTHTILAAIGLVHRQKDVYPIQTRRLTCNHSERFDNMQNCSCFDTFVRNVVMEIFCDRLERLNR